MALTGRFNLRKTWSGRIVLQVEEEAKSFWSVFSGKAAFRRRWRDATVMDLAAPELRALVDLRFRPRFTPPVQEGESAWPGTPERLEGAPVHTFPYEAASESGRPPTTH